MEANFVGIKNKWSEIYGCCSNNCINPNKPVGNCIEGNGFGNLINDENIKYINCLKEQGGKNAIAYVHAENSFKKPHTCFNYSLYYFEVKCIFEGELNQIWKWIYIGLKNCRTNKFIKFSAEFATVFNEKAVGFYLDNISWKDNDIFGCGLVYPPTNMTNEFPYVFFTQNGKQIGKAILLNENSDSYKPSVFLMSCSIEANFGNNLEAKPFNYEISKHEILKEFY
ncbi:unnamed protein product [Meloidogyne enterolobii]|uniref:Uncharacterized protein n=1 Tax=Meloidogyne enterolobii TaxID=390850 RepID=A0ACB0YYQ3_MELEN